MLEAIKSLFNSLTEALKAYESVLANQTTSEVVSDKKQLKKASNITEQILEITDKYEETFDKKDKKQYNKLKAKFLKVN